MRAKKVFEEEYSDAEIMLIKICMTFGIVCFILAELVRVVC